MNPPPDCSTVFATPATLWPPNHKLQLVTLLGCSDSNGDIVTVTITGVTQNEAPGNEGARLAAGGRTEPSVATRRTERRLGGSRYTITFVATDGHGGSTTGTLVVLVPHDLGE